MRVAITGAEGFLGWHTSCRLRSTRGIEPVRLGRAAFYDETLDRAVADADVILHLAGVNRADSDDAVEEGNLHLARELAGALSRSAEPKHVVYANSIQAKADNPYGRGKAGAADLLEEAVASVSGTLSNVMLPNLFGEHGRPSYNSFVATFCDSVVRGTTPTVANDRQIPLLHAQKAAEELIRAAESRENATLEPAGEERTISEVLELLQSFKSLYVRGEIPDVADEFSLDLFNTYRSFVFPSAFPISPTVHRDDRGSLFETVRAHGGTGQAFVSTTAAGATRGDHYHLQKIERFFVVKGQAEISLRRLYTEGVVSYRLSGDQPSFVDMPTMWVHNIKNIGDDELITMFWSDQLLDPDNPDQYPEKVELQEATP